MSISELTKQSVRERANYLCEYCHSLKILSANRLTIDHVIPRSLGGSDDIENLALACRRCNPHSALQLLRHILVTKTRQFDDTTDRNSLIAVTQN